MFEFKPRKAIQINCSLFVNLPNEWKINQGIVKGQELLVAVDEQGNLVIKPNRDK